MPPKKKIPPGELTSAEIRKLIRAHNTLVKKNLLIKIPAGTTREGLIKLVEDKGYTINHSQKKIEAIFDAAPYDFITLDRVDEILRNQQKLHYKNKKQLKQKQQEKRRKRRK